MGILDFLFGKKKTATSRPTTSPQNRPKPETSKSSTSSVHRTSQLNSSKNIVNSFDEKKLQGVDLGGGFTLVPLENDFITDDKFPLFATFAHGTPNIAKWLPGFDLSTPESAIRYVRACVLRKEMGLGFTYLIKIRGGIVGMMFVNTPRYNETTIGFPHWTIDFFLIGMAQGHGFMPKMLLGFFFYLKNVLHISEIYSIVDSRNIQCLSMLDKCLFYKKNENMVFTDPATGNKAIAFYCNLKTLKNLF